MAAFTSKAAGNWSSAGQTTWNEVGVPGSGDTVTTTHAITVDTNTSCGGITAMGAALTVATDVTFTLFGDVNQGDANFIMSADSHLVFNTTGADRKWIQGTATGQTNCIFIANGTSGSHCTVSKTGGNECWFDGLGEGSGANWDTTAWDCTYVDFEDIGTGVFMNGLNTFGSCNIRFDHCTFDGCSTLNDTRPYGWRGAANKDYYVRDCKFTNSVATYSAEIIADCSSGSGTTGLLRNSFDKSVNFNSKIEVEDNFFQASAAVAGGPWITCVNNIWRVGDGDSEPLIGFDTSFNYWLGNLNHLGNPHCFNLAAGDIDITDCIFEIPNGLQGNDGGECVYGNTGGISVLRNLCVPSAVDGAALGNVAHNSSTGSVTAWIVEHNTCVGDDSAYIAYTEQGSDTTPLYSSVKSNLVVDLNGSTAAICFDVFEAVTDMVATANVVKNGKFGQLAYADATSGQTLQGYRSHFTTAPGGTDVTGDPEFVDPTRCFSEWAVYKGAASGGDSLTTKTNASIALIAADPTLIASDLMPWVKGGYAPTNAAFEDAGHDGDTIGAVAFAGGPATAYTFTGPSSGDVNVASTNFTVTPNGDADGIEVTPATDGSGSFTPSSVTFTGSDSETFTYTPTSASGSPHTLSVTDDGGLTDPANIDYTVNAAALSIGTLTVVGQGSSYVTVNIATNTGGTPPYSNQLQRAPDEVGSPGTFANVGDPEDGADTDIGDGGLDPETTYWYRVVVTDDASESDTSNEVSATTDAATAGVAGGIMLRGHS